MQIHFLMYSPIQRTKKSSWSLFVVLYLEETDMKNDILKPQIKHYSLRTLEWQ